MLPLLYLSEKAGTNCGLLRLVSLNVQMSLRRKPPVWHCRVMTAVGLTFRSIILSSLTPQGGNEEAQQEGVRERWDQSKALSTSEFIFPIPRYSCLQPLSLVTQTSILNIQNSSLMLGIYTCSYPTLPCISKPRSRFSLARGQPSSGTSFPYLLCAGLHHRLIIWCKLKWFLEPSLQE